MSTLAEILHKAVDELVAHAIESPGVVTNLTISKYNYDEKHDVQEIHTIVAMIDEADGGHVIVSKHHAVEYWGIEGYVDDNPEPSRTLDGDDWHEI